MKVLLIIPALLYCILMFSVTYVNESIGVYLFGTLVLVLGSALCKATNWMDKEEEDAPD
jgi:hypothetical protein